MRRLHFALGFLCLASLAARAGVSLNLSADATAVARGGTVTYEVRVGNGGPGALEGATLSVPLPAGIDQWSADVRIDGGPWEAYPPNGLLALDPLPAGNERLFEIRAPVELGAPGTLPTEADVLDPSGPLASASVEVNVLPSVDAGPDLIVEFGGSVTLAGASAGDGGSGLATIEWSDGGAGGGFDDPSILHATYTPAPASGLVELALRVVDHDGGEADDSLRIRVNAPPTVDAGADRTAAEGDEIPLDDATASDADGWIVTYAWSDGGAGGTFSPSEGELHPAYVVPTLDGCGDAAIELTLTVIDDWGGTATDTLVLTAESTNTPPIVDAGDDRTVESGGDVSLVGDASDGDGDPLAVRWEQTGGPEVDLVDADSTIARFVAPDVDEEARLDFHLRAVDSCGETAFDDVRIVVRPTAGDDGTPPSSGPAALSVTIEAFDAWGLPLSPLDTLTHGSDVRLVVEATNVGEGLLGGLEGKGDDDRLAFLPGSLAPWERASATFVQQVDVTRLDGEELRIAVDVRATGPNGETVSARAEIVFFVARPSADVSLEKTVDRVEAEVGETVTYTYTIRNDGDAEASDLELVDDRLGPIPLPRTSLAPGETLVTTWTYTVRESDLPGPLTNAAILTGFGLSGVETEAASIASIEVLPTSGGAGGSTLLEGPSVVISEVAWAGTRADPAAEWIELVNVSGEPIDLSGWALRWRGGAKDDWREIELSGAIEALPDAFAGRVDSLSRLASAPQGEGWKVFDVSWWGIGEGGDEALGFYVLERGSDRTLSNVDADLVYDPGLREGLDLPDGGTVLLLVSPDGATVDSANASTPSGWAAGEARGAATMERVNLLRADEAENWQTNPGILTSGRDAAGERLAGTAGMPNSPSLETLTAFAAADVATRRVVSPTSIRIPIEGAGEPPWIFVTIAGSAAAGGGGAAGALVRVATHRTEGGRWIDVDPSAWPTGTICVWVVGAEGEAFLLSLARGT